MGDSDNAMECRAGHQTAVHVVSGCTRDAPKTNTGITVAGQKKTGHLH